MLDTTWKEEVSHMIAGALDINGHKHESDDALVLLLLCQTIMNDWRFRAQPFGGLCLHGTAL